MSVLISNRKHFLFAFSYRFSSNDRLRGLLFILSNFFNLTRISGHASDVKCVDWHPHKCLLVSGSKYAQEPIILWDTKSGHKLGAM